MILRCFIMIVQVVMVTMETTTAQEDEVWSVTGVSGRSSDLPCYLNPRTPGDRPKLILWYKKGTRTPVFGYDGRIPQQQAGLKQQGSALKVSRGAATLTIKNVGLEDAGLYECRVDFFKSPSHNSFVNVTIVEPPKRVEIHDSQTGEVKGVVGPYYEGQKVIITCFSIDGKPLPNVTWWRGDRVVDGVWEVTGSSQVQNNLVIEKISRTWHNQSLTCTASNTHLAPPVSSVVLVQMFLLPTSVEIVNPGPVYEGEQIRLECTSKGSRPPSTLYWSIGEHPTETRNESSEYGVMTSTSTLVLNVTREDNGTKVRCTAKNPTRPRSPITNSTTLVVYYPPSVNATLGKSLQPGLLEEGNDVYFTCTVSANPPYSSITWYHEGKEQVQNLSLGVILTGDSLVLQKVNRRRAGEYTCSATNPLSTSTSLPVTLRIKYTPECLTSPTTYFIYDKPINVTCTVSSYPAVKSILWQWNNSNDVINTHPIIESAERAWSVFTVRPISTREDRALSCWAVNEMGKQSQPCGFTVKVAQMPMPLSSCRLANITASSLSLSCQRPDVTTAGTTLYRAEVYFENRTLFANVTSHRPNFNVSRLDAGTSYQIKVYVTHGPVTSQPVVVSAYTSRSSLSTAGDTRVESGGSSVGGVVGGLVVTVALLAGAVLARQHCKRRSRRGSRKQQEPRPHSEDSNPDVVPSIEETYDLLSPGEVKREAHLYDMLETPLVEAAEMTMQDLDDGRGSPPDTSAYRPLVLKRSQKDSDDYPGMRADLYCPVDQLMDAEESVV